MAMLSIGQKRKRQRLFYTLKKFKNILPLFLIGSCLHQPYREKDTMPSRDSGFYSRLHTKEEDAKREDPLNVDSDGNPLRDDSDDGTESYTSHYRKNKMVENNVCPNKKPKMGMDTLSVRSIWAPSNTNPHMSNCVVTFVKQQRIVPLPLTMY